MIIEAIPNRAAGTGTLQTVNGLDVAQLTDGSIALTWREMDFTSDAEVLVQRQGALFRPQGEELKVADAAFGARVSTLALDDGGFSVAFQTSASSNLSAANFGANDALLVTGAITDSSTNVVGASVVRQGNDFVVIHSDLLVFGPFVFSTRTPIDLSTAPEGSIRLFNNGNAQRAPDAALLENGNVVYAYQEPLDGPAQDILLGALTPADGFNPPRESVIEAATENTLPQIAALAGGGFVTVFLKGTQIQMRLHDEVLRGVRDVQTPINLQAGDGAFGVTALPDGGFVIVFATANVPPGATADQIRARRFDANGDDVGFGFEVASLGGDASDVGTVALTTTLDGRVVVAWDDVNGDDPVVSSSILDFREGDIAGDGEANVIAARFQDGTRILGQDGDDRLIGRQGEDELIGGAGDDMATGGGADDMILGQAGRDDLRGGAGADEIEGGNGADMLAGGKGRDSLDGGRGNDALDGGGGGDELEGGRGRDEMAGGGGRDMFVLDRGDGRDLISDFTDRRDKLVFEGGAQSFADLTVRQRGNDTVVDYGRPKDVAVLQNFDAENFSAQDVMFV